MIINFMTNYITSRYFRAETFLYYTGLFLHTCIYIISSKTLSYSTCSIKRVL